MHVPSDNPVEATDEVALFIKDVLDKGLSQSLEDIGLSEYIVHWLDKEAGVPPVCGRTTVRVFAFLADKASNQVGTSLLELLKRLPFFLYVKHNLNRLLAYICDDLRATQEYQDCLNGRRSGKVSADVAKHLPLDLQGMLTLMRQTQDVIHILESWISMNKELLTPQPSLHVNIFEEETDGLNRFLYGTQKTQFLGREKEISELERFLTAPKQFCWMIVTGEGGLGKSRLALELCLRNGNKWRAGFLPTSLCRDDYIHWTPNQPTLIIADYAAYRASDIGDIIRIVKTHADDNNVPFPVRLLILERHERRYFRGRPEDIDVMQETWFNVCWASALIGNT